MNMVQSKYPSVEQNRVQGKIVCTPKIFEFLNSLGRNRFSNHGGKL